MPSGYTFDSSHGPGVGSSSAGSSGSGSRSTSSSSSGGSSANRISNAVNSVVKSVANAANTNTSLVGDRIREVLANPSMSARSANLYDNYVNDYGLGFDMDDYLDQIMSLTNANNDWSANQAAIARNFEAAQAEKQMQYQTRSDQAAMAWSAQEAAKSRQWTENLSNTAHQREVKDLLAAGLNPILAANNGAWAGSGATGSGFSSNGAMAAGFMGQTDMSISGVLSNMLSGMMTTGRDLAITKMNTDAQKYATDKQFAASKMAAETSIFNNNNNIDANKAIRALDRDADIRKASISADATRAAAAANAGAITSAAAMNAEAARYSADQHLQGVKEQAERQLEGTKYTADTNLEKTSRNLLTDPIGYGQYGVAALADPLSQIVDSIAGHKWNGYSDNKE